MARISFLVVAALAPLVIAPLASAQTSYDWRSGNSYSVTPRPDGGAHVHGFNSRTGSTWNQTVQPNGNMNGFDSQGNSWTYDRRSGSYLNSNGRGCIGHGAGRTCW